MIVAALTTVTGNSVASDRELTDSPDFRVRVTAAVRLARAKNRVDLEDGLKDSHPAVRIAAAGGLKDIGDAAAVPALERALRSESFAAAKQTMQDAITALKAGSNVAAAGSNVSLAGARYVVQLGQMTNASGTRGNDLDGIMRSAARAKAGTIKGAVIIDGNDAAMVKKASAQNIPVLQIDGTLNSLKQKEGAEGVVWSAKVDMSVRKLPGQTLRGTITGSASAGTSSKAVSDQGIRELQNRIVSGAVESAVNSMSNELASLAK
jgi:hypothetical protein